MTKLCVFVGTLVGGYGAWFLGEQAGLEFFGCFLVSGVGSLLGVWLGWKLGRRFE